MFSDFIKTDGIWYLSFWVLLAVIAFLLACSYKQAPAFWLGVCAWACFNAGNGTYRRLRLIQEGRYNGTNLWGMVNEKSKRKR